VDVLRSVSPTDTGEEMRLKPDPLIAPKLAQLNVTIDVVEALNNEACSTYVAVTSRAGIGSANDLIVDFERTLRAKLTRLYEADAPLWLAMPLENESQLPAAALEAIYTALPSYLGQFSRLIVGTLDDAEIVDQQ